MLFVWYQSSSFVSGASAESFIYKLHYNNYSPHTCHALSSHTHQPCQPSLYIAFQSSQHGKLQTKRMISGHRRSDTVSRSPWCMQTNKRGLKLQCSHFIPEGVEGRDGRLPCVIYCHCNSGSRRDAEEALCILIPLGVSVFALDFAVCWNTLSMVPAWCISCRQRA